MLSPGDRIDLKKQIADTLERQEWQDIDLTLTEFGFPVTDRWDGDERSYILASIRDGNDEALSQLDSYLHPTAGAPVEPQPAAFDDPTNPWAGTGLRLFLSHEHGHAEHAGAIRRALSRRSVDAFVAHDSIEPTEEWKEVILNALRSCDACLALLTPKYATSNWCDQEIGFCIARDLLVIPVDYGKTPYGFLGDFQSLKIKEGQDENDIALAVFELLIRKPQTRDAMARALVERWGRTSSYREARENYGFLRAIPKDVWKQTMVDDVWRARDRNNQLREADINWQSSESALETLLRDTGLNRPQSG